MRPASHKYILFYLLLNISLPGRRRAIQKRRRGMLSKGVSILHDNARPHNARQTVALLQNFEGKDEVQRFLKDMAASWYDMGILKLPQRLQKCIDRNGDYVEK
uniref:Histone-lysine N-methyltransferase SETMAR n=1 Tax=Leptobrachium leishanense TaxID=445787 RepID=A0A8C5QT67_9ANUR